MKIRKRVLSIFLVTFMLLTVAPLANFVGLEVAPKASAYSVGDTIEYGNYPQTRVEETPSLKAAADAAVWKSYGYYLGFDSWNKDKKKMIPSTWNDGKMQSSDFMIFADFFCNGTKYRAVHLNDYRAYWTGLHATPSNAYQDDNGYIVDKTYYFKYEPLIWRILDPSSGFIQCESIVDSQSYQNRVYLESSNYWQNKDKKAYANNYAESSIRRWLNFDFYETAFTPNQKENIEPTVIENKAYSITYKKYDSETTTDKVFCLTYADSKNSSYGYSSNAIRKATGTDYAKSQGLIIVNGYSWWWTRSAGQSSCYSVGISEQGKLLTSGCYVNSTRRGVRPACKLYQLKSDSSVEDTLFSKKLEIPVKSSALNDTSFYLPLGMRDVLVPVVTPEDASNESVIWSSSNSAVITVNQFGMFNTQQEGISYVTAETQNTQFSSICKIVVRGNNDSLYSLGEETYSFKNYVDKNFCNHGGHCFGMATTSSLFYLGLLDQSKDANKSKPLFDSYERTTKTTIQDSICFFQSAQGRVRKKSIVAGDFSTRVSLLAGLVLRMINTVKEREWNQVINYVKSHRFDNKGGLIIIYGNNKDEHGINFLRYKVVNGQERIYAYDNNYPEYETWFYKDTQGNIQQIYIDKYEKIHQGVFNDSINHIGLCDANIIYQESREHKKSRVIFANENMIAVENADASYLVGNTDLDSRQVLYELSDDVTKVRIVPLTDDAEFIYMDQIYHVQRVDENTIGMLTLAESEDSFGTLNVINDPNNHVHIFTAELTVEPTCIDDGEVTCTCTRCNNSYTETIGALGHYDENNDNICDACGCSVHSHIHSYTSAVTTPATCTSSGVKTYTCVDGDDIYTEIIPSLGHIDKNNDGKCDNCKQLMTGKGFCKYCGQVHTGFFQKIIGFFHSILALFGLKKK